MDNNNGFSTEFLDESQVLHASFRVAAESVTQLYKTAFQQKNIGYEQCLKDLLEFIESHPNVQQTRQQLGTDGRDAVISVDDLIKFMHLKKEQLSSLSRRSRDESSTTRQHQQPQQQQFIHQNQNHHQHQHHQQQHHQQQPPQPPQPQPLATSQQNNQSTEAQFQISNQQIFEGVQSNFNFPVPSSNTTDNNNQNIQYEIDRLVPSQDGSASFLNSNDSLKRRYNHNNGEINFLGRQITLDSSLYEPSHKKGRFRKDES